MSRQALPMPPHGLSRRKADLKKPTRNAASMKMGNMLEIIDLVRRDPVSRADVARTMGLTRAAITIIVDRLEEAGISSNRTSGRATVGRRTSCWTSGTASSVSWA